MRVYNGVIRRQNMLSFLRNKYPTLHISKDLHIGVSKIVEEILVCSAERVKARKGKRLMIRDL
jgi:hypothetical protein